MASKLAESSGSWDKGKILLVLFLSRQRKVLPIIGIVIEGNIRINSHTLEREERFGELRHPKTKRLAVTQLYLLWTAATAYCSF